MFARFSKYIVAAGAAVAISTGALARPAPASADTTSTMNTILGAAAVVGGIVLYNNYEHKKQQAQDERYGYGRDQGYRGNGGNGYGNRGGDNGRSWSQNRGNGGH